MEEDRIQDGKPAEGIETAAGRGMSARSFDIENESFQIIESEIGVHDYSETEWKIVRRIIHATADFDFAKESRILFGHDAIGSAFSAIRKKSRIVTDVDMVLSAINKRALADLGLIATCHISDKAVADESRQIEKTRSEVAMQHAAIEMNGGIVIIGNAPTALLQVIRMVREGITRPALVIGLPVGFVAAAESKAELARTEIPFITNIGRKGGSSAAAASINAILLLYRLEVHI